MNTSALSPFWAEHQPILCAVFPVAQSRAEVMQHFPQHAWKHIADRARKLGLQNPTITARHAATGTPYQPIWEQPDRDCQPGETKRQRLARVIAAAAGWPDVLAAFPHDSYASLAFQATTCKLSTAHFRRMPRRNLLDRSPQTLGWQAHHRAMLAKYARTCPRCGAVLLKISFTAKECPDCYKVMQATANAAPRARHATARAKTTPGATIRKKYLQQWRRGGSVKDQQPTGGHDMDFLQKILQTIKAIAAPGNADKYQALRAELAEVKTGVLDMFTTGTQAAEAMVSEGRDVVGDLTAVVAILLKLTQSDQAGSRAVAKPLDSVTTVQELIDHLAVYQR